VAILKNSFLRFYEELLKQEGIELRPQEKEHEKRRFVRGAIKESKEESSRDGVERVGKGNGNKDKRSDSVFHNEDSFSNNILYNLYRFFKIL
jgi:hypothetical protein